MKNHYKDERVKSEADKIYSTLFKFLFLGFTITIIIKITILQDYSIQEQILDLILFSSIAMLNIFLLWKRKLDLYESAQFKIPTLLLKGAIVGSIVMLQPLMANNFQISGSYLLTYAFAFIEGVLAYLFVVFVIGFFTISLHKKVEKNLEIE